MNQFEAMLSPFLPAGSLLPLLIDFTWKAICFAAIAVPLMVMLRRTSASTRHLGWLLILAVMMVIPFLSGLVPAQSNDSASATVAEDRTSTGAATVPVESGERFLATEPQQLRAPQQRESPARGPQLGEPQVGSPAQFLQQLQEHPQQKLVQRPQFPQQAGQVSAEAVSQSLTQAPGPPQLATPGPQLARRGPQRTRRGPQAPPRPGVQDVLIPEETPHESETVFSLREAELLAASLWLAGVLFLGLRVLLAQLALRRILGTAGTVQPDGEFNLAVKLVSQCGIRRPVRLLVSDHCSMPMTCGVLRPAIVLPKSASTWSPERLRMVLLHELAHVRRLDCLWQWLSFAVTTCHWFNPLVWLAASRLRVEREQACDDEVLNAGVRASDYAETLLDISTGGRRNVFSLCAGVAMASSHRLSGRVHAIVDERRNRRAVSRSVSLVACLLAVVLLVPLSLFARTSLNVEDESSSMEETPAEATSPASPDGRTPETKDADDRPPLKGTAMKGDSKGAADDTETPRELKKAQAKRRREYSSISLPGPGHSYLRSSEDHSALVGAALKLLDSSTERAGTSGYRDTSLQILLSPARNITSSFGLPKGSKPRAARLSRLYVDTRNVFGPDEIHTEVDGARQNFSKPDLKTWVAFRREFDRVRFRRPRPIVPATGKWSRPVNGLQARLAVDNWRDPMIGVFLELRNRKNLLNTITVPISPERLTFQLRDENGKVVMDAGLPRSGPVANLRDVQLPFDSSLRFNVSVSGVGIDTSSNAMIPLQSHAWVIRAADFSTYQLSASLKAERLRGNNDTVWHGDLQIPAVSVKPASRERVSDTIVTKSYEIAPGQRDRFLKQLTEMFAAEENVELKSGDGRNEIKATARGSRHLFLAELVEAMNSGSASQTVESRRVWLQNHQFDQNSFTFVRARYNTAQQQAGGPVRGVRWATDYPDADLAFSARLAKWTSLDVDQKGKVLNLTDEELTSHPFVYLAEPGGLVLSDQEVTALRSYLTSGGFLMMDDFWGEAEWLNVKSQMKRVFPDRKPVDLPLTHKLFRSVFPLTEKPQVCSVAMALHGREQGITWERPDGKQVHYWGLTDPKSGRLMAVLCHNTDLADGWERGRDSAWYAEEFSEKRAWPMGINIVFYALTQ